MAGAPLLGAKMCSDKGGGAREGVERDIALNRRSDVLLEDGKRPGKERTIQGLFREQCGKPADTTQVMETQGAGGRTYQTFKHVVLENLGQRSGSHFVLRSSPTANTNDLKEGAAGR